MNKILLSSVLMVIICISAFSSCKERMGKVDPPVIPKPVTEVDSPVVLTVYLENSGSMDGYVNGNTGFKQTIYYYLTELRDKITSSIHLFYINSKVISMGNDIKTYIHSTTPTTFKANGGDLGTSDIATVLDSLLSRRKKDEVVLFISDCVVSPGKKYATHPDDINGYLLQQCTDMTSVFRRELNKYKDLTVAICQLQSHFDGKFFNKIDQWSYYKGERPFYFWLIGSTRQIKSIMDKIPWSDFNDKGAKVENLYVLTSLEQQVEYAVVNCGCWGSFEYEHSRAAGMSKTICKVKKENKGKNAGKFRFSIGVDLNFFPLDDNYLYNSENYQVNNKDYSVEVIKMSSDNFSHQVSLTTEIISPCQITVSLKNKLPDWVNEKTDFIGQDLIIDKAENKTFGLKYLVEGVYKAFVDTKSSDDYAQFIVTIK